MRQQRLRDAIVRAYDLYHQADSAVSVVASMLTFRDFDYDTYTCDSLIVEDLFEGMRKDGIENIKLVSRGFKYHKTVKNEDNNRRD